MTQASPIMNTEVPVHLGLERILDIARLLGRAVRHLRIAFAIEQRPPMTRERGLV